MYYIITGIDRFGSPKEITYDKYKEDWVWSLPATNNVAFVFSNAELEIFENIKKHYSQYMKLIQKIELVGHIVESYDVPLFSEVQIETVKSGNIPAW